MGRIVLSENERRVLEALVALGGRAWVDDLQSATGLPLSTIMSVVELLKSKGLVQEESVLEEKHQLTKEGAKVLQERFPEERLLEILRKTSSPIEIRSVVEDLGRKEAQIAIGALKKRGAIEVERGRIRLVRDPLSEIEVEKKVLKQVSEGRRLADEELGVAEKLVSRGLMEKKLVKKARLTANVELARKILEEAGETVSRLTSKHITSGEWRRLVLREYNVEAQPPRLHPGIRHFYRLFMEKIRRILFEMGFTEVTGPFIEREFWNFDVLFQAQDHPAREVHDTFWLDIEATEIDAPRELIEKVREVHERGGRCGSKGWRYTWDERIASRLILRSQTTSVTARALWSVKKPPFRIFTIGKNFRPDVIDARHLPEFFQLDAIVGEEDMSFSKLLGYLKEFFERLGFEKLKFKPAYFPFTEPSVEGYLYIEGAGWVEVFGAGMFRPEVLEMLGAECNVGAWGMGLDRIAMQFLGVNDIRKLYSRNVSELRSIYRSCIAKL